MTAESSRFVQASNYCEEMKKIIECFEHDHDMILSVGRGFWESIVKRLMLFSVAQPRLHEKRAIQEEREGGGVPSTDDLAEDATQSRHWVHVDDTYSGRMAQDADHCCCDCILQLEENDKYYRLKRCRVYLCTVCYNQHQRGCFGDTKRIVALYLDSFPGAIPIL